MILNTFNTFSNVKERDFGTIDKCLAILQKLQADSDVFAFWIHIYNEQPSKWISVTIFKHFGDEPIDFVFSNNAKAKDRMSEYFNLIHLIEDEE